jgi:hypothetical protein
MPLLNFTVLVPTGFVYAFAILIVVYGIKSLL